MYYIIGALSDTEYDNLRKHENSSFEFLFSLISPTCWFVPSFGKSFHDKLRFTLRLVNNKRALNDSTSDSTHETILEIEEIEKRQK